MDALLFMMVAIVALEASATARHANDRVAAIACAGRGLVGVVASFHAEPPTTVDLVIVACGPLISFLACARAYEQYRLRRLSQDPSASSARRILFWLGGLSIVDALVLERLLQGLRMRWFGFLSPNRIELAILAVVFAASWLLAASFLQLARQHRQRGATFSSFVCWGLAGIHFAFPFLLFMPILESPMYTVYALAVVAPIRGLRMVGQTRPNSASILA